MHRTLHSATTHTQFAQQECIKRTNDVTEAKPPLSPFADSFLLHRKKLREDGGCCTSSLWEEDGGICSPPRLTCAYINVNLVIDPHQVLQAMKSKETPTRAELEMMIPLHLILRNTWVSAKDGS